MTKTTKPLSTLFVITATFAYAEAASAASIEAYCASRPKDTTDYKELAKPMAKHNQYSKASTPEVMRAADHSLKITKKFYGYSGLLESEICSRVEDLNRDVTSQTNSIKHALAEDGSDQCKSRQYAYQLVTSSAQKIKDSRIAIDNNVKRLKKMVSDAKVASHKALRPLREDQAGQFDKAKFAKGNELLAEDQNFYGKDRDPSKGPSFYKPLFDAAAEYTAAKLKAQIDLEKQAVALGAGFAPGSCPTPAPLPEEEMRPITPNKDNIPEVPAVPVTFE